jgi:predicted MFS family arabinose efflux permease
VVTHAVLQVPAGRVVDRAGARRAVVAGLMVIAVSSGLGAIAPISWLAITARGLAGVGSALVFIGGSDALRAARASVVAQGAFGGAAMAAAGISVAVLPIVEPLWGWRVLWLSALVVSLGALAVVAVSRAPFGVTRRHEPHAAPSSMWRDPHLYRLAVFYAATYGTSVLTANWIVTYLEGSPGFTSSTAALIGSVVLATGLVARPLGGVLAARRPDHTRRLLVACTVSGAAATTVLATRPTAAVTLAATTVIGIAAGIPFGPTITAAQRARPDGPAAAVGLVNGVANLVIVAGVPLIGLTFALPGDGKLGFVGIAALWILGLVCLPRGETVNDRRPRSP